MNLILKTLTHRNFLLILSLSLGYLLGDLTKPIAEWGRFFLALTMTFAMSSMSFNSVSNIRIVSNAFLKSFLLNYILFGGLLLLGAFLFFNEDAVFIGFVLLAASPPGPSVIPFSFVLKGNVPFSSMGVFLLHLVALLIVPLLLFVFLREKSINLIELMSLLTQTIIIPFILSRFLRYRHWISRVDKIRPYAVNWGFFFVILPILGLSKAGIHNNPSLVVNSFIFLAIIMVGGGFLLRRILRWKNIDQSFISSYTLMYSTKSSAFVAVAVFSVFPPESSIPAAIHAVWVTLFFMILGWISQKSH